MFRIVALVYVLLAGQPIDEPLTVNHKLTFMTLGECQEYLKGDEFGKQREALGDVMSGALLKMRSEANAEDQPLPAVAITASCTNDPRL